MLHIIYTNLKIGEESGMKNARVLRTERERERSILVEAEEEKTDIPGKYADVCRR